MAGNKKTKKKPKLITDIKRPSSYQVSRSLPDLRNGPKPTGAVVGQIANKKAKKGWRNRNWRKIFKRTALTILILLIIIGGWLGYKLIISANKTGAGFWGLFGNGKLKGEDRGRVNILLAGDSSDDPGHAGGDLTDSIMVVSVNTKDNTAYMLSVPRDLYVNIPNYGYAKINEAYQAGNQQKFHESGYPNGGMGLLEKTVSQKLGIPIDYYALINYTAFKDSRSPHQ